MIRHYLLLSICFLFSLITTAQTAPKGFVADDISIVKVADHVYQHITYFNSETFGKVSCNGMIVFDKGEAIIFDTPVSDSTSAVLLDWLADSLKCKVKAVIATHFHEDCVAGLNEFHRRGIPSYGSNKTIASATLAKFPVPQKGFDGNLTLKVGKRNVETAFVGEGHTKDNVVGYFPSEKALFGGCLIKELDATKGNLADANVDAWPATVTRLKAKYPGTRIVIPGHGKIGDLALLDYTIRLFEKK
ncbi:Metallo-beta-lactamase type 2 [Dyadobacter sp. CECT 9623]|uniref:beta-lactamase n=1 Tax=Dyadobacter linearis TaxID=2823330 RepID=A0ABM8UL27_9BACT|nr:subclass B1 metallo-beta-lactamase [Dyadobacter sp. CECT 9623]CAG5068098.1 Metallo-beta-lactamase type 2 [Dyadobacter sp. CECT 9623]